MHSCDYTPDEFDSDLITHPLVQALTEQLLRDHGATMGFEEIGKEFGTTAGAVRVRQFRVGDLPPPIAHLRESRWPTPVIALWLCGLRPVLDDAPPASAKTAPAARGRGRPRKLASPVAGEGQA